MAGIRNAHRPSKLPVTTMPTLTAIATEIQIIAYAVVIFIFYTPVFLAFFLLPSVEISLL